jgi:hypothetical protein
MGRNSSGLRKGDNEKQYGDEMVYASNASIMKMTSEQFEKVQALSREFYGML